MSGKAERLQDAIGLIKDEYVIEAHEEAAAGQAAERVTAQDAGHLAGAAGAQGNGKEAKAADNAQGNGKVVKMPPQRRRYKAAGPIAIAACLVVALGVGALTFSNMNKPVTADIVEKEAVEDGRGDAEVSYMAAAESSADGSTTDCYTIGTNSSDLMPGIPEYYQREGEAFILTAGEWNDNDNWPFFLNLVNSGTISFPSFGLDPTHRVKATVTDASGNPVRGEEVVLVGSDGQELWRGVSGKDGAAYLFYEDGQSPLYVSAGGVEEYLPVTIYDYDDPQGEPQAPVIEDVSIVVGSAPEEASSLQVMFIVDTTGSMTDEIAYLQKDFASIAGDVGSDGISYSVNFYRDEGDAYVTKCNGFTSDVATVQSLLNDEYAEGGGDTPEAVAQILSETITYNGEWRSDCDKIAFLIFDAPPHDGTDEAIDAAVRSAAEQGIRLVPVVASNADRGTELFGRALAIMTDGTYVFLTDDSGVGESHLEPIVGDYSVELLHDVIVRIINDNR